MIINKEMYGDTIDGTLGVETFVIELDDSDTEAILEQIYPYFRDMQVKEVEVSLNCPAFDDKVDIDVDMDEYLDLLIEQAKLDEDYMFDLEFTAFVLDAEAKGMKCK